MQRAMFWKSDCVENRFQSFAEILAASASWKTRQMSALRSRVEISNDRRPHFMVLRALPEASAFQSYAGHITATVDS